MFGKENLRTEALAIVREHGDDAARVVAERTVALNLVGHEEGVHRYRRIAAILEELHPADWSDGEGRGEPG